MDVLKWTACATATKIKDVTSALFSKASKIFKIKIRCIVQALELNLYHVIIYFAINADKSLHY